MKTEEIEKTAEQLVSETLFGDVRDSLLTHIRSMETPWSKMSEQQQSDKIYAISKAAETVVRRAVTLIASQGHEPIFARISKFTVKDEIKAELVASSSVGNIEKIAENIGHPAIVIFASPEAFMGEARPAKADKDQPELVDDETETLSDDDLYEQAVAAVRETGKASTSFVQRKFGIGYNRAAAVMERMEAAGVVSAADNTGKRSILPDAHSDDVAMPDADPADTPAAA